MEHSEKKVKIKEILLMMDYEFQNIQQVALENGEGL